MAIETSPVAIQANTYSAELFRRGTSGFMLSRGANIGTVTGGVCGAADFTTTYGGSGLGVTTSAGEAIVPGTSSTSQGGYYVRGTGATTNTPAAANPSNPRIDLIYLQVNDAAYTGSTNNGTLSIATGTPTSGATLANISGAPSLPTSSLALAYVLIPAAATSITNSDIQNLNISYYGNTSNYLALQQNIFKCVVSSGSLSMVSGYHVTVSGNSGTYTLPAPFPGAHCRVTNYGSGVPTVAQHASEVIYGWGLGSSGAANFSLGAYGATATVESDGVNWFVTAGMQDSGWVAPAMTNSWTNTGSCGYRKIGNVVRIQGSVTPGSGTAFTLPTGYQPTVLRYWPVIIAASTPGQVSITSAGAVGPPVVSTDVVYLDSVSFTVD